MIAAIKSLTGELRWLNPAARTGLGLLLLLAGVAGGFSWQVEPLRSIERQLYNVRVSMFPEMAEPDQRMVMVVYTDETLFTTGRRSPVDRSVLATALTAIAPMAPRTVTVDLVFDIPQQDDDRLIAAMRAVDAPLYLQGPDVSGAPEVAKEYIASFVARAGIPPERQVSLEVPQDDDGLVRNWPQSDNSAHPLLAHALSEGRLADYRGPIRFRSPASAELPVIERIPIEMFADPEIAPLLSEMIVGRHVLIGFDAADIDRFQTPLVYVEDDLSAGEVGGLELQAHMLAQALDGQRYWKPPTWFPPLLPLLILPLAILTAAVAMPRWCRNALTVVQVTGLILIPFVLEHLFEDSAGVSAFGWLVCWAGGYLSVLMVRRAKAWEQGRIAQSALTRYLPPDIAEQIVNDPSRLALNGQRCHVFALFSDMEGFTGLCQSEEPANVAEFLNEYLETLSQIVLDHGGTIDKFVGDAVVAFWGAPLAREGDGERAARAAVAIHRAGEAFRSRVLPAGGRVGRTRVGLHYGEAIVGNFGGDGRIQYTALGDTMNLAARLEGANKQLGTSILLSREAAEFAGGIVLRTMGQITVRGRSSPVAVLEPGISIEPLDVQRMNRLYEAAAGGDAAAFAELKMWADERDFDLGLGRLVERLAKSSGNGVTQLS